MTDVEYVEIDFDEYRPIPWKEAYLLIIDKTEVWIPKSLCEGEPDTDTNTVSVVEWKARDLGLV